MRCAEGVLVVIPAWNEAGSVPAVVAELRERLPGADVLVVDDGSTDATAAVARAAGARVARLPINLGVGGARRLGYRYALAHGYRTVLQLDADGQHDPAYLPAMLAALDGADLVIGARFAGTGRYPVRGPRRWAMALLAAVLSRVAGTVLTDTTSGLRATGARLTRLYAGWYPAEYLGDTVETLVRAARAGYRIRQVPVAMRPRRAGVPSQSPLRSSLYLARVLLALALSLVRR